MLPTNPELAKPRIAIIGEKSWKNVSVLMGNILIMECRCRERMRRRSRGGGVGAVTWHFLLGHASAHHLHEASLPRCAPARPVTNYLLRENQINTGLRKGPRSVMPRTSALLGKREEQNILCATFLLHLARRNKLHWGRK